MRLFSVEHNGTFREYVLTPFHTTHEEAVLEDWLEKNPDGIVEDGKLLIIDRQVSTALGGFIVLLARDRRGKLVVVELKRNRTPRDTLAQAVEYVSFAAQLTGDDLERILHSYLNDESLSLAEHHRAHFGLAPEEAVAFNKDQRIVIVGQQISPEIRQTASYLRSKGLLVTCVEFSFFQSSDGTKLLSQEIVVGQEPVKPNRVVSGSLPVIGEEEFMESLDEYGKPVFKKLLDFARERSMPIHWGTKGFSLNVDLNGQHVAICFCYPPGSVYQQSIYTALKGRGRISIKTGVPEDVVNSLWRKAEQTGLFQSAGSELKCTISRLLSDEEISSLLSWCEKTALAIREYGLKE